MAHRAEKAPCGLRLTTWGVITSVHIRTWQESAFLWAWLIVTILLTVSKLLGS